jgi:hypothetical protein
MCGHVADNFPHIINLVTCGRTTSARYRVYDVRDIFIRPDSLANKELTAYAFIW